jgi:hypothetical protein
MSDTPQAPAQQPAPQPAKPAGLTFDQMKEKLVQSFEMMYAAFCKQLSTIPCSADNSFNAMRHFDDGFFNFREGIRRLRLEDVQQSANDAAKTQEQKSDVPPAA